ncbi:MAG: DNA translocase FtsK 4TM domain-containing protein [Hyphomicrobiaceae bacterium]
MSLGQARVEPRPLLPNELEEQLVSGLLKVTGLVLGGAAVVGWLCLLSWSANDPSLTHSTSGTTHNLLGPLGAIASDLLIQTLGFVAVFIFLWPAFSAYQLYRTGRIPGLRLRAWIFPIAIIVLAGAFSAVPTPQRWPLNHGMGGMVGDAVYALLVGLLSTVNPARAGVVAGLVMFVGGMSLLSIGLGLSQRDWARLWQRDANASAGAGGYVEVSPGRRWRAALSPFTVLSRRKEPAPESYGQAAYEQAAQPHPAPGPYMPMHAQAAMAHNIPWSHRPRPLGSDVPELDDEPMPHYQPPPQQQTFQPQQPQQQQVFQPQPPIARRPVAPTHVPAPTAAPAAPRVEAEDGSDEGSEMMAARFAPRRAEPETQQSGIVAKVGSRLGTLMPQRAKATGYQRPSLNLLKPATPHRGGPELSQPVLRGTARLLEEVLRDYSIQGEVKAVRPGPVVTLFELEPARGTKASRIVALSDDIARSMCAVSARVAPLPGRNLIGIELPNVKRETVMLRELLESEAWRNSDAQLPIVLGKSINGDPVIADLARMPHALIAGTTGSGKSVSVNAMILSLLFRMSPEECRLLLIDPKMLELSIYNDIPHLLAPVVTDPNQAARALGWAVMEMEERYKRMAKLGVRNIELFNNRIRNARKRGEMMGRTVQTGYDERTGAPLYEQEQLDLEPMPYIVIVVDEMADLMATAKDEIEGAVQRLAQMARAAGIHLVMATQRPSVDVVTGTIKANLPTRIAFKVASKIDSRTILGEQGAEQLLGRGDMLYASGTVGGTIRVHGPLVSDEEAAEVADVLRRSGEPHYVPALMREPEIDLKPSLAGGRADTHAQRQSEEDDLYDRAVALVHRDRKASISLLQRRLSIGFNRAAGLIERMEADGIVSTADGVGRRRVLLGEPDASDID